MILWSNNIITNTDLSRSSIAYRWHIRWEKLYALRNTSCSFLHKNWYACDVFWAEIHENHSRCLRLGLIICHGSFGQWEKEKRMAFRVARPDHQHLRRTAIYIAPARSVMTIVVRLIFIWNATAKEWTLAMTKPFTHNWLRTHLHFLMVWAIIIGACMPVVGKRRFEVPTVLLKLQIQILGELITGERVIFSG